MTDDVGLDWTGLVEKGLDIMNATLTVLSPWVEYMPLDSFQGQTPCIFNHPNLGTFALFSYTAHLESRLFSSIHNEK
jgi:hypothetical protein